MLAVALYLQLAVAVPTACAVLKPGAQDAEVAAMAGRCVQDLRSERWQEFSPAEAVIATLGARALDALLRCVAEEGRDDPRGRCVRSAGLLRTPAAYEALFAVLERGEAGPSTLGALCYAMEEWRSPRALPALAKVLRDDEYPAHAAARAMYAIDPTYYRTLSEPQQLSYAIGISDSLSFQRGGLPGLATHAPALAERLVVRLRGRELSLAGKSIYPGRLLLLLKQLGGQSYAADVLAFGEAVTDDATRASVLELLGEWGSPIGRDLAAATLRAGLQDGRARHLLGVRAAARYLRKLAKEQQPGTPELLGALWRESASSDALRCELVFGASALRPRPPAIEIAKLLDGPCEHDLTILLNTPEREFIRDLVAYLRLPKAQRPQSDAAGRALAWQCAARLKLPICQPAAPFLRGVRRPSHPD